MNARRAAADLLVAVMDDGRSLDDALSATPSFNALEGRDRAFARALTTAGLRRMGGLNAVLSRFLDRPLPESAHHARALLHLGAAQLLVLGTPAHAAVGETVETANAMREARGFAKLMNAVLRKVARDGAALLEALPAGTDLPPWLFARWRAVYGERASDIAAALLSEPPLDLSVKEDPQQWAETLGGSVTPTGSVRLPAAGGVETLAGFDLGAWWVQDAAAALPERLLGDVRGKRVLDLCAAPGGKTLQLAAAGARVTAVDKTPARLERLRQNLRRTNLDAEIVCADALTFRPAEPFDAILLDAPCTSTGTLRRHPDVAWLRRPSDIRTLADLQNRLVSACAPLLKPGAPLVYAVCSLEPEEGEDVVDAALASSWQRSSVSAAEVGGCAEFITRDGALRTLPSHWPKIGGLDGFFAARLVRA
ncbi:MAG: methyltransferase domain-containing protein [Hyphomonadaceae bacterium]|nr:methyltransferase domain-containing protein [Hyphomonadaceae bacterium]